MRRLLAPRLNGGQLLSPGAVSGSRTASPSLLALFCCPLRSSNLLAAGFTHTGDLHLGPHLQCPASILCTSRTSSTRSEELVLFLRTELQQPLGLLARSLLHVPRLRQQLGMGLSLGSTQPSVALLDSFLTSTQLPLFHALRDGHDLGLQAVGARPAAGTLLAPGLRPAELPLPGVLETRQLRLPGPAIGPRRRLGKALVAQALGGVDVRAPGRLL
mmetsp:Transcript_40554/g.130395  ORF Transcript_40554/g.130395 Transcript_40554/m.130395 type:complete len:216 (+) Transcript_40554:2081-2728(+)